MEHLWLAVEAVKGLGGSVVEKTNGKSGVFAFDLRECPRALRDLPGVKQEFDASFSFPPPEGVVYLGRTSPLVAAISQYILETALDGESTSIARRSGCIRTRDIDNRTTLLLLRLRFQIVHQQGGRERRLLAEDCRLVGFTGSGKSLNWIENGDAATLLGVNPSKNLLPDQARDQIRRAILELPELNSQFEQIANKHGEELLASHLRVREAATLRADRKVTTKVEVKLPVDIMGVYVFLPEPKA